MIKKVPIVVIGGKGGGVTEGLIKALRLAEYENINMIEFTMESAHLYRVANYSLFNYTPENDCFVDKLIELCKQNNYKVIIPGPTWEARALAARYGDFVKEGIYPIVNNYEAVTICNDKWETFKFLDSHSIGTPYTYYFKDGELNENELKLEYPVLLKPRVGRGSQNIFIIHNTEELKLISKYLSLRKIDFVVQEYVGSLNDEYTIGVISDKNANVIDSIVMKRKLGGGYTDSATICEPSELNLFCEKVAKILNSTGPLNIQLRMDKNNQPKIFEINPRFSGTAPMRAIAGFNEPDMIIRNFVFDEQLTKPKVQNNLKFYRVFQEFYLDKNQEHPRAEIKDYI
ncbi:MAG: ATP-grasp domain-containing protein [Ignavibacteriaceae bacterium]|jgi:carbamoyl-phosphate synthase large subunit|nr:ATP-grasp domain-containing protein [Ignavibacteriaceae bacterium]